MNTGLRNLETIVALATPRGIGALALIRISGEDSLNILKKIFFKKKKNKYIILNKINPNKVEYGFICEKEKNELKPVDEVLITYFNKKSFTGEEMVEISCHGSHFAITNIIEIILKRGARLAEPGEFTRRAFLNGRIDLIQAEAINDLINSRSIKGFSMALSQLEGKLSSELNFIKAELAYLLADIEAFIDFPEDEVDEITCLEVKNKILPLIEKLDRLISGRYNKKIYEQGIETVIVGEPNVGKSSLFNELLKNEKAIVTPIAGTTRDIIESVFDIEGVIFNIIDTAGLCTSTNPVENIGIEKAFQKLDRADLVLLLFSKDQIISEDFKKNIKKIVDNKKYIPILNKTDIKTQTDKTKFVVKKFQKDLISISVKTKVGIEDLKNEMLKKVREVDDTGVCNYLINERQSEAISKTRKALEDAIKCVEQGYTLDMLSIEIGQALNFVGELVGFTYNSDILEIIFSKFCVGK